MKDLAKHKFPYEWHIKDGYPSKGIEYHGSTVFSCFSCGGGSTMGYKLAGYNVIGCNEIDPKLMDAYKQNHNPQFSFLESIETFVEREDLPDELYELDVLDGSPPCSSFSLSGNRQKDWGRKKKFREGQVSQVLDLLFFKFIKLADKLKPKVVISENVIGIIQGLAIDYAVKIISNFNEIGYKTKVFVLDSSHMGVPQKRKRVFFISIREDVANKMEKDKNTLFDIFPSFNLEFNEPMIPFCEIYDHQTSGNRLTERAQDLWDKRIVGDRKFSHVNKRVYNKPNNGFNTRFIYQNEVHPTLVTCSHSYVLFNEPRYVGDSEKISIGSFPKDYKFINNAVEHVVGMSVPPVMMAQLSNQVFKQILSKT